MLDALRHDLKHAFRALVQSRGFSAIAIASLAIGIAGNATIFSVADALLLRPLPGIADPDRLVDIGRTQRGNPIDTMSYPNFADLRERSTVFAGLAAYRPMAGAFGLTVDGSRSRPTAPRCRRTTSMCPACPWPPAARSALTRIGSNARQPSWCSATRCGSAGSTRTSA